MSFLTLGQLYAMPVYDGDDRTPVADAPEALKPLFSAVAVRINNTLLNYNSSLDSYTLNEQYNITLQNSISGDEGPGPLCSSERFVDYQAPGNCTGFLVGPDILVTAGHCIKKIDDCKQSKWIFDFTTRKNSNRGDPFIVGKNVYECKEVIESKVINNYATNARIDYAIVRLDRKVEGRTPLKYRKEGELSCNDDLFVVGHPNGLPMIYAPNGHMSCFSRDQGADWFLTNLDTFSGNSGSPVFNKTTGLVEGILVRGAEDYAYDFKRRCYVVSHQPGSAYREGVNRIKSLQSKLESL